MTEELMWWTPDTEPDRKGEWAECCSIAVKKHGLQEYSVTGGMGHVKKESLCDRRWQSDDSIFICKISHAERSEEIPSCRFGSWRR